MKKSLIALLLSVVFLFGSCDINGMMGGESVGSATDSTSTSIDSAADGNSENDFESSSSSKGENDNTDDGNDDGNGDNGGSDGNDDGNGDNGGNDNTDDGNGDNDGNDNTDDGKDDTNDDGDEKNHVDKNNDDLCDECGVTVAVSFNIFAINDLHGKFADSDTQPGVDELTTYIKNARAQNENTIVLSSGDMWQGSAESNATKGKIVTEWMNELDCVGMAIGNHEFDWGQEYIVENAAIAEFPFLAINIYSSATNALVDYCQPSVLIEQNGVKIGIIGAVGDCYSSIASDKVGDIYFKTGSALTSLVKAEAQKLREQGADCILYSIHDGYGSSTTGNISDSAMSGYYDISLSSYVDMVFEAHTHQRYVLKDSKGVYHMQDGGDNDGISQALLKINFANDTTVVEEAKFVSTSVYSGLQGDPIVQTLMDKYAEEISIATRVLGTNDKVRGSDEILQKVADLYYEAGEERWGEEYNIVLGGGFMSARSPYEIYAGEVLYGDLMSVLPFDNQLVLCRISGRNLRSKFFETSNSRYYISYGKYGETVKNSIQDNAYYYVVTDTYSSGYASNGLTEVERYDETTFGRDLLAKFIEDGGWGAPAGEMELTSIPDALAIGKALATGVTTSKSYYVKGKITSIKSTTYGNLYIEDENGNRIYVYGTYDITGAIRYDSMSKKPVVGDTIIIVGAIMNYNGTIEIISGRVYSIE